MPCPHTHHIMSQESISSVIIMTSGLFLFVSVQNDLKAPMQDSLQVSKQQGFELVSCCTGTPGPARPWQWWWPLTRQMTWPRRASWEKLTSPLVTGTSSVPLAALLLVSMAIQHPVPFPMGSISARMILAFRLQHGRNVTQQRHAMVESALWLCCFRATPVLPASPLCLFNKKTMLKLSL